MKTLRNLVLALTFVACASAFAAETPAVVETKDAATVASVEPAKVDAPAKKSAKSRKAAKAEASETAAPEQK